MSDPADPLAWVERAEEDYVAAQSALRRKKPATYVACFHAQQCAEKYLKALLVAGKHPISRVHDLLTLYDQCAKVGVIVAVDTTRLDLLSEHAVQTRYPGDLPTLDEAREAWEIAKVVRRFARKFLGIQ